MTQINGRFYGSIKPETDSDGTPVVRGKIKLLDGFIYAEADTQDELGKRLDELVLMVLDKGLHDVACKSIKLAGMTINQN